MKSIFLFLFLLPFAAQAQIITTIAGGTATGFAGDGGPASSALFSALRGIAIDGRGNVFVADAGNHRVRRIDANGIVTTVAGNGTVGYGGDWGPATAAQLNYPASLAADSIGNLFIWDSMSYIIRRVDTAGVINTVAGNGLFGDTGDGGYAFWAAIVPNGMAVDNAGNVFMCIGSNHRLRMMDAGLYIYHYAGINLVSGNSGDGGPANVAKMYHPMRVATCHDGTVLIGDTYNNTVRMVDTSGNIQTIAGIVPTYTGGYDGDFVWATSTRLNMPYGIAKDLAGNVYIADNGNNRIRKVDGYGIISTICGNGTPSFSGDGNAATDATINAPTDVAVDAANNIYFFDAGNSRVRKISGITGNLNICTGTTATLIDEAVGGIWSSSNTVVAIIGSATGIVTAAATGTTTITYSNAGVIAIGQMTVNPSPGAITGAHTLCAGQTDTLADTAAGGIWTSGTIPVASIDAASGIVTGVSAGIAFLTYTLPAGCNAWVSVTVKTLPAAGTIHGTDIVCPGDSVLLSDAVGGGVWSSDDDLIATISGPGNIIGVSPGITTISYTVTNSCGSSSSGMPVTVLDAGCFVGVPVTANKNEPPIIFPDPAANEITVISKNKIGQLVIKNLLGQTVYCHNHDSNKAAAYVAALPAGVYIILINGGIAGKFVKE